MSWPLIASTSAAAANTPTTAAINCIGANLLVVVASAFGTGTVFDSSSNIWQQIGPFASGGAGFVSIYYVLGPTVSASQTFSYNGGTTFTGLTVTAWSGSKGSGLVDQTNHAIGTAVATLSAGSITPSASNSLVIAGLGSDGGSAQTIGSSFTIQQNAPWVSSVNEGSAIAYLVQGAAAAINPAWSWTTSANAVAIIASFAPAPANVTKQTDGALVTNLSGASTSFILDGGAYSVNATVSGGGTIVIQQLGSDGSTWLNSFSPLSANGIQEPLFLPPGTYRFNGGSGLYAAAVQRIKFA